jgi:hypothetical protein
MQTITLKSIKNFGLPVSTQKLGNSSAILCNPETKLFKSLEMDSMTNIIDIQNFDLDLVESDGTSHWIVTATVADMVQVRPATYHPADCAEPAEYGPALCWASFQIDQDQLPPPISGTLFDQINYLDNLDLDWELEDEE